MRKILPADTLTPILAYMRVQGEHKVILESIPREKENARFSIIAYNPVFEVTFKDGVLYENGKAIDQDPFEYLDQVTVKGIKSDLPFAGGAIGFAGYDMIGLYENIGEIPEDTIGTPDMHFFIYESYLIFDHKKEKVYVVEDNIYSGRDNDAVRQALGQVVTILQTQAPNEFTPQALQALQFSNHIEKEVFMDMVAKAKKLIREGDMFQCVLSQRFSADFEGDPLDYYRNLRVTNPSNYLYFYDFGDYQVIGASPESLVSVKMERCSPIRLLELALVVPMRMKMLPWRMNSHMMLKKLRNTVCWLTWDVMILVRLPKWYGQGDQVYGG